jgi:hypothetical protein
MQLFSVALILALANSANSAHAALDRNLALDQVPSKATLTVDLPLALIQSEILKTNKGVPYRVWSTTFSTGEATRGMGSLTSHCTVSTEDRNFTAENPVLEPGIYEVESAAVETLKSQKIYILNVISESKQKVRFDCKNGWGISIFQDGIFKVRNFNSQFTTLHL